MTKNGRPSLLNDIRHFVGEARYRYLDGHREAEAFGRRIAWFLNGEGFSAGAHTAIYLHFTPDIVSGSVRVTGEGGLWWHRFTHVGVPPGFPDVPDAEEIIKRGTVEALVAARPDQADLIRHAEQVVRANGVELRFLLKRLSTKKRTIDVSFSIGTWPARSRLHLSILDHGSDAYLEAPPVVLSWHDDAFDLVGAVRTTESYIRVEPKKSFTASLTSRSYGGPLSLDLDSFVPRPRPVVSKLVKRTG
jgi:hypothetical protein